MIKEVVIALVARVQIDTTDDRPTALQLASIGGYLEIVNQLTAGGAQTEAVGYWKSPPQQATLILAGGAKFESLRSRESTLQLVSEKGHT